MSKRRLQRRFCALPYKPNVVIITEGAETEEAYLRIVMRLYTLGESFNIIFVHRGSGIPDMLRAASEKRKSFDPKQGDTEWIVLDRDAQSHTPQQFANLAAWESAFACRRVALSNPRFEYWLLLHKLEPARARKMCMSDSRVEEFIPSFKHLPIGSTVFDRDSIRTAIKRADSEPRPTCAEVDVCGTSFVDLMHLLLPFA